jgi:hypothetical protein
MERSREQGGLAATRGRLYKRRINRPMNPGNQVNAVTFRTLRLGAHVFFGLLVLCFFTTEAVAVIERFYFEKTNDLSKERIEWMLGDDREEGIRELRIFAATAFIRNDQARWDAVMTEINSMVARNRDYSMAEGKALGILLRLGDKETVEAVIKLLEDFEGEPGLRFRPLPILSESVTARFERSYDLWDGIVQRGGPEVMRAFAEKFRHSQPSAPLHRIVRIDGEPFEVYSPHTTSAIMMLKLLVSSERIPEAARSWARETVARAEHHLISLEELKLVMHEVRAFVETNFAAMRDGKFDLLRPPAQLLVSPGDSTRVDLSAGDSDSSSSQDHVDGSKDREDHWLRFVIFVSLSMLASAFVVLRRKLKRIKGSGS